MKLTNKYQLEICKAMLDRKNRVRGCLLNENDYAVTFDGYRCFVFGKDQVVFDISKIEALDFGKIFEGQGDVLLHITEDLRRMPNGQYAVKLEPENKEFYVWVNNEYLKGMESYNLLGCSPLERILIFDLIGNLVGAVLPIDMQRER